MNARRHSQHPTARSPETLQVLIDLENTFGRRWAPLRPNDLQDWLRCLLQLVPDHAAVTVVACSGLLARVAPVLTEFKTHVRAVQPTPDAADLCIEYLLQYLPARTTDVLLMSGDGLFAHTVQGLVDRGITVTVAGPPSCIARDLRAVASATLEVRPHLSALGLAA